MWDNMVEFDIERASTHRIHDLTTEVSQNSFTRNSKFPYSMSNGAKVYENKQAELKIERYGDERQVEREGKRIGYLVLNLNDFIGQKLQILTFKMDNSGSLYLTVKLAVVEYSESQADILTMSMRSIMQQKTANTRSTVGDRNFDEDDDSSEEEVHGESLMSTYKHFHNVQKQNQSYASN